jgi:EAL domain-containing protein (putative c-di-GMP-specific phosphodiesterase class I)
LLTPDQFITLAEETGSLEMMDWQIFNLVCRDLPQMIDETQYISINVAPRLLRDNQFVSKLMGLLDRHRVRAEQLRIEITEGALLEQPELVERTLKMLRDCGISTMLDDFGTGYSSLSYLHRFPLNGLKIDRSFVSSLRIGSESGSSAIVQAIRVLAGSLNIQVIAEGVETEEQRIQLRSLGIPQAQGFLFSKPHPKDFWMALKSSSKAIS